MSRLGEHRGPPSPRRLPSPRAPHAPARPALPGPGLVNAANALTVLRLALVPIFVACLLAGGTGWRVVAFIAFSVASVTDLLDGRIARRRGLITDFGKIADPIADKALTGSALVTLSALGELPWWVTAVILAREICRDLAAVLGHPPRRDRGQPGRQAEDTAAGGGDRPVCAAAAAALNVVREAVMAAAVVVTVVTGIDYGVRAVRLHRRPLPGWCRGHAVSGARRRRPGTPAGPAAGDLAARIVGLLTQRRQTVAVAESLTGGLLGAAITTVPGASAVFRGGVIAYATELKAALLGVPDGPAGGHGERLTPTWRARWRRGSAERLGATIGVATTGVAGPDPQDGKPPGTVHIAVSAGGGPVIQTLALSGGRDEIRRGTAERSLRLLWSVLGEECPLITALRHQRTRPHALSRSVGKARYRGCCETDLGKTDLGKGARPWSCFVTCLVTRCGGCAFGRVAPSVRFPRRPGCRWDTCPRSSAGRRKHPRNCWRRSAPRSGTPLSQVFREVSDNFALAELQSEPVLAGAREPALGAPAAVGMDAPAEAAPAFTAPASKLDGQASAVLDAVRLRPGQAAAFDDEVARRIRDVTDMVRSEASDQGR